MQNKVPAAMFWSGGKDSALALHQVLQQNRYNVQYLITTVSQEHERISMHGVRKELLQAQAAAMEMPLKLMYVTEAPDNTAYENALRRIFTMLQDEWIGHVIYGDIFLEDLKKYRDNMLQNAGLEGVYPLWKQNTGALYDKFIENGFKAITVSVSKPQPGKAFAGRVLDEQFRKDLPDYVDPCGENGEYHTFVFNGPIFNRPVAFEVGNTEIHGYKGSFEHEFYFTDLLPVAAT